MLISIKEFLKYEAISRNIILVIIINNEEQNYHYYYYYVEDIQSP